jgi:hypothetical protein
MSIIPGGRADQVKFFNERIEGWQNVSTQIGLTSAMTTSFAPLISNAVSSENAAESARLASKDATTAFHVAVDKMTEAGRGLVATIKAYAEATNDPNVYALASLPPPKTPGKQLPPDAPIGVTPTLKADGTIEVSWDASVSGTAFSVWRRTDPGTGFGPLEQIGTVGSVRSMIDSTLTGCVRSAAYSVKAVRGTLSSALSAEGTIRFAPGGETEQQQAQAA